MRMHIPLQKLLPSKKQIRGFTHALTSYNGWILGKNYLYLQQFDNSIKKYMHNRDHFLDFTSLWRLVVKFVSNFV